PLPRTRAVRTESATRVPSYSTTGRPGTTSRTGPVEHALSHRAAPQSRFLFHETAFPLVRVRQCAPDQAAEGCTVPGDPQVAQLVDENQVDQRRRQLQDGPVHGDRAIRGAGTPT